MSICFSKFFRMMNNRPLDRSKSDQATAAALTIPPIWDSWLAFESLPKQFKKHIIDPPSQQMYQKWYQGSLFHYKNCLDTPSRPTPGKSAPPNPKMGRGPKPWSQKKDECLDGLPKNRDEWGPNTSPKHMPQTMPSKKGTNAHSFFFVETRKKKERMRKKMERMQTKKGRMHIRSFFVSMLLCSKLKLASRIRSFFCATKKKRTNALKKRTNAFEKRDECNWGVVLGVAPKKERMSIKTGTNAIFTHSSLFLCPFVPFSSRSKKKGRMS